MKHLIRDLCMVGSIGGIGKVSRSTSIGKDLDYYNTRPTRDDDYHGNGLVLLALAEIHALHQNLLTNPKENQ